MGRRPPARHSVIACDPAFALEISYRTQDILDRINRYFGYRAIANLRILQVPRTTEPAGAATASEPRTSSRPSLDRDTRPGGGAR